MKKIYAIALALCVGTGARAQAPSSLQYPPVNVYITQTSNVYLAPTVAGNVSNYTISPDITATTGLSFNTNTGVISGTPTIASPIIPYTVTAFNGGSSTSATFTVQSFNYYYNNANAQVSFLAANRTFYGGTNGTTAGSIAVYSNVATLGGQAIDCIVRTASVTTGTTWASYDQPLTSGGGYSSNSDNFFSPQFTFPAGGGNARFDFQFILGGTYDSVAQAGTNVVLQNVQLNTYDIDGNSTSGGNGSNQYNEFGGFSTYELNQAATNITPSYNATSGLTRFRSNSDINITNITDPTNRIRVSYGLMSTFSIVVGAEASGSAFFFLDFSTGGAFTTAITSAPSVDLNTSTTGVNNGGTACANALFLTGSGQTNAASANALNEFTIRFPTASITNGASERLVIRGASAGSPIPLNFANAATIGNVTAGGMTYAVAATVAGGTSTLSFTNSAGGATTFTLAQFEALLDSLQYENAAPSPSNGIRNLTVNVRNNVARSPDAIYSAALNCVAISGNVYHDANGMTDNTVNASGSVTGFSVPMYAVLVNNSTGLSALPSVAIAAGSAAYNFGNVSPGKYNIYFSTTPVASSGLAVSASTYPSITTPYAATYYSTGENLGAGAGTDGSADGRLIVTVGSVSASNANFGLQVAPIATATNQAASLNPGGYNYRTITGTNFGTTDADGSVSFIRITAFPTGANALRVGTTVYTNGGTCPPQSVCTAWPGTLDVAYAAGAPSSPIAVDPATDGATTVSLSYRALDNGGALSPGTATISVPFNVNPVITISGNVWNDVNGNGVNNGAGEPYTAVANAGQQLYALLVQTTNTYSGNPTVFTSTPVTAAASGYSFSDVPAGNNYEVRIVSLAAQPQPGVALSTITPALAATWTGVSTNNNGVIVTGLNGNNPSIALGNVTASAANVNFGIERIPQADAKAFTAPVAAFTNNPAVTINGQAAYGINAASASLSGSPIKSLSGSDAEDCATASSCSTARSYRIQTINSNTALYYNGLQVASGATIPNFDPINLVIYGQRTQGYTAGTALGFTYSLVDAAGVPSAPVTYTLQSTGAPLPVSLVSFTAAQNGNSALLGWEVAAEKDLAGYTVQRSTDGSNWTSIGTVAAEGRSHYQFTDAAPRNGANFYRLQMADLNGGGSYSASRKLEFGGVTGISILPNPVVSQLTVNAGNQTGTVVLLNATGAVVLRSSLSGSAQIDMSGLPAGVYLVQVLTGSSQPASFRVTKQ